MANLLDNLSNLGVHRLLVGGHSIKFGGQLINRLIKSFISLDLGCYKTLHETLQVGFRLRRWNGWVVWSSILEIRRLCRTLGMRVRVLIERIGVTLLTLIVDSRVGTILW